MFSALSVYVLILSGANTLDTACHDRLELAIRDAGAFVGSHWTVAKAEREARKVARQNQCTAEGFVFVRNDVTGDE